MASLGSDPALATESAERLIESLFPQTPRPEHGSHKPLSESDLRRISDVLQRMGKDSWSRVPRIYAVLRTINQLQVLDSFIAQGVSDIWFPFSHKSLPDVLRNPSARFEFLEAQGLVLTKALDLERDDGKHRHFSRAEDIPLSKLEELGKGGFGYVDRVLSTITYKEYARKLIPRGRTFKKDMEVLRDFERELGHLKKLSHLHIVELVGSYTDPKFVGILMSPVADYNLKEFLALDPLPAGGRSFLRTFFGCLASALCYLHDNRVRHKDVKPQNVLVKGHQVYLTDFGISLDWSELGQSTTSGPTIKTPRYCAPEVADWAPRNSLSDVWSLGCVFLEIWTVLKGETVVALLEHLENRNSRSTCYYLNCDAVKTWCETLIQKPGSASDNPPSACISEMMQLDQDRRWTARMTLNYIQEVNADPDNRFAFSGLCCVDDGDSDESLNSSKRNSANLDETGASSLGVPPIHTTPNLDKSAEMGGSAVDLNSSQTLKPSKVDKPALDSPRSNIEADARQENRNLSTPSYAPTDAELGPERAIQDEISKEAQLPSERSISTPPDPFLSSDLFADASGVDRRPEDSESLERSGGVAAASSDNLVLRSSPLNTVASGIVDQMEQSEIRDEPALASSVDRTSPHKLTLANDIQQTTTIQDSSDDEWHDSENSKTPNPYESPIKGPERSRKFSFSDETTESTIFKQPPMNEAVLEAYDARNTTAQGSNLVTFQNSAPKIQATESQQQPRVPDWKSAVQQTAIARKPVAVDRGKTSGNPMKGIEAKTMGNRRTCTKCGEPVSGQFVRALGSVFHLTCFKCQDCGLMVATKFFPVDDEDGNGNGKYPLCETDYFRRLDLLCYNCGHALRGSYITALDRKYHVEHFACKVCRVPFGARDSYYEHEGQPYCEYHYCAFAQICRGCTGPIFKQFVEIFRNGQDEMWHPECYMIHKFWNVRLGSELPLGIDLTTLPDSPTEEQRGSLRQMHVKLEESADLIWTVVQKFEESCAWLISDMVLHVNNGAYSLALSRVHHFLGRLRTIFGVLDRIHQLMTTNNVEGVSYIREAKLLCKKIVATLRLISDAQEGGAGARKLRVTQEMLSTATGLAHYLKLLIRICLQSILRLEGHKPETEALAKFLDWIGAESPQPDFLTNPETISRLAKDSSDRCASCQNPIDRFCIRCEDESWHKECLKCSECSKNLGDQLEDVFRIDMLQKVVCSDCMASFPFKADYYSKRHKLNVVPVTELEQYTFLISVAMARLVVILQTAGITISEEPESSPSHASVDLPLPPGQSSDPQSIIKGYLAAQDDKNGDEGSKSENVRFIEGTKIQAPGLENLTLDDIPRFRIVQKQPLNEFWAPPTTSYSTPRDPPPVPTPRVINPSPSSLRQKTRDLFLKRSTK